MPQNKTTGRNLKISQKVRKYMDKTLQQIISKKIPHTNN